MRARLPQGNVQVVIRHSSFGSLSAPTYHASFDVMVLDPKSAPHLQHFDAAGTEMQLVEKAPELGTDAQLKQLEMTLRPDKTQSPVQAPVFTP